MGISKNNGTPKSSILIGFSIIFTIHFGGKIPLFLETPPCQLPCLGAVPSSQRPGWRICRFLGARAQAELDIALPSWWLNQPIWKICSSNWKSSQNWGENKKYLKPPSSYTLKQTNRCNSLPKDPSPLGRIWGLKLLITLNKFTHKVM